MNLLELPSELLLAVFDHVFDQWTATMDLTCQLGPIKNIKVLRTCRFFYEQGVNVLNRSFSGVFIRDDARGCIKDPNLEPKVWYSWIIKNCRTLVINDAYYTIWYIPMYWAVYPKLEKFIVKVRKDHVYNDPATEMPNYEARRQRCDLRTQRFERADYSVHGYLLDEVLVAIYKDMVKHKRKNWPSVAYSFFDCRCHQNRQSVFEIRHSNIANSCGIADEYFVTSSFHVENSRRTLLHTAQVQCIALQSEHGLTKSLGVLTIEPIKLGEHNRTS